MLGTKLEGKSTPLHSADTFPKDEKIAVQDESGFVLMLNRTNIWISAVRGSHGAVSLNSKEMPSDSKSPVAASDMPGTAGDLDNGAVHVPQVSPDGSFTQ